jgi:hypothetical protein
VELDWPTSLETPTKSLFASSVAIWAAASSVS